MPRDLFRQLFLERAQATQQEFDAETVSRVRIIPYGTNGEGMPVVDIRYQTSIIPNVPISSNNHELLYAQTGTPIRVRRSITGRIEVVGLSKRKLGNVYTYTLTIPTPLPVNSGTTSGITDGILLSVAVSGFIVRTVTLGELESISGFGTTPLEALALFNASGGYIRLV